MAESVENKQGWPVRDVLYLVGLVSTLGANWGIVRAQLGTVKESQDRVEVKIQRIEEKVEKLPVYDAYFRMVDQKLGEHAKKLDVLEGYILPFVAGEPARRNVKR